MFDFAKRRQQREQTGSCVTNLEEKKGLNWEMDENTHRS